MVHILCIKYFPHIWVLSCRDLQDLRCIVFVERVITAIVLQTLLDELLLELTGWKTEYAAGSTCKLQSQSRKKQNKIVDEFRKGAVRFLLILWKTFFAILCRFYKLSVKWLLWVLLTYQQVNIIVATSMLEEGLDVQSCNLVIRFDPSTTVCSFIQSRGRARMQDSVFLLLVKRYVVFQHHQIEKIILWVAAGLHLSLSTVVDPGFYVTGGTWEFFI